MPFPKIGRSIDPGYRVRQKVLGAAAAILLAVSAGPGHAQSGPGGWEVQDTASALDGERSYVAILESDEKLANILGDREAAHLFISCTKQGFFADILWPDFIENNFNDLHVTVRWKLDDGPIQKGGWIADTKSVGRIGNGGFSWVKSLVGAKKLIVQVPDRHGGQDATFELDGIGQIYNTLTLRSCG